jgi:protein-arginine deiminase
LEWPELLLDNYQYQEILDNNKHILLKELQLKKTDIYEVPICFWPKSISDRAKSIIPNMVNSLYTNQFMLVPKPFGPNVGKQDLFEEYFVSIIPKNIRIYFINNWDSYYLLDGDIHCGTNVKRTPFKRKWWSHMPSSSYDILA